MRDWIKKAMSAFLAAALIVSDGAVAAIAQDAASQPASRKTASFKGVEVSDDFVAIKLSTAAQYNSFLTQAPPRLVVELLDTKDDSPVRSVPGKGKYLARVRSGQYQTKPWPITRVVLDLVKMAVYRVAADPRGLSIQLAGVGDESSPASGAASTSVPAAPAPVPEPSVAAAKPVVAAPVVAPIPVPESAPSAPRAAPLPKKRNSTTATAFKRAGLGGKMSPELAAMAEAEDTTKIAIAIPESLDGSAKTDHVLGGRIYRDLLSRLPRDPVTLDFDDTDVRDVIKLLAVKAKINIIFGSDVQGTLTLHLSNVPFNEAFRTVLTMMRLSTDQVGDNVLRVITPAALAVQRTSAAAITKVIPLNYAKAADVKKTIDSVRLAEGRPGSSSVDTATNSLIVTESFEGMLATENLISQLDQRPRQVLIEAKLVEVNLSNELDYGIQWDAFSINPNSRVAGQQGTSLMGTTGGLSATAPTPPLNQAAVQTTLTSGGGVGAAGRGTGVSLAADRVFGALTLGRVTNTAIVNATLTAAASEGKARVLSDPKIATLNNQAANINVTTQIPYVTSNVASTGVQTQTVSYATTGIQLTVTPSINADGRILLLINPNVSQPSVTAAANTQTGAPAVDSRTAQTSVIVRDGETIVIGGLINDSLQDTVSKIPLLGDIPVLGWLFKKSTKKRTRNELLIFVTTRVVPD